MNICRTSCLILLVYQRLNSFYISHLLNLIHSFFLILSLLPNTIYFRLLGGAVYGNITLPSSLGSAGGNALGAQGIAI